MQHLIAQSCEKFFKDVCTIKGHEKRLTSEKEPRVSSGPMTSHGGPQNAVFHYFNTCQRQSQQTFGVVIYFSRLYSTENLNNQAKISFMEK